MAQLTPFSYHEVIEACRQSGCPICRLGNRAAERYLVGLIYDSVNDVPTRARLRQSWGFCRAHSWHAPEAGESAPLGLALIYRDLLLNLARKLETVSYQAQRPALWQQLRDKAGRRNEPDGIKELAAAAGCPACERQKEMEGLAITAVVLSLTQQDLRLHEALSQSDGFCLTHLQQALARAGSPTAFEALLALSRGKIAALIAELDEFIRKNDHRFQHEGFQEEADSWRRALRLVAGNETDLT
jgi:hypothetical protein